MDSEQINQQHWLCVLVLALHGTMHNMQAVQCSDLHECHSLLLEDTRLLPSYCCQTCQLSRIMRESHTFGVFLTLTCLEEVFSCILPFSVINIFIIMNHTYLIDVTPISTLINFNNYYKESFAAQ